MSVGNGLAHAVGLSDELEGRDQHSGCEPEDESGEPEIEAPDPPPEAEQKLSPFHRHRPPMPNSIPEQLVDRGLGAGALINRLHNHRAIERRARRSVWQRLTWHRPGDDD